jgi:hypothetical protein
MTRTRVAAPQYKADAAEVAQSTDINLNPGRHKGQETVEVVPAISPRDIETEAFFNQPVTIMVNERQDTPIPGIVLNVNGEDCAIPFGRLVTLKRKFVQHLLEMRETTFTQPKRDQYNVEAGNALKPRTTLLYPFAVSHDPHPHGMAWLQREQQRIHGQFTGLR